MFLSGPRHAGRPRGGLWGAEGQTGASARSPAAGKDALQSEGGEAFPDGGSREPPAPRPEQQGSLSTSEMSLNGKTTDMAGVVPGTSVGKVNVFPSGRACCQPQEALS